LTGEALSAAYASADIFLFPSVTETFGNVVTEAMASGLAVAPLIWLQHISISATASVAVWPPRGMRVCSWTIWSG